VNDIKKTDSGWVVSTGETLSASRVVIAAGLSTPAMVKPFGLNLDITPLWLHCGYTTDVAVGQPMPLTIDLDTGLIIEREGNGACVTVSDTSFGAEGAQSAMEAFAELAELRAPIFTEVGMKTTTSAAFDATGGDGHAYLGEIDSDLWVFAGFDGHGTMQGPALSEIMANIMRSQADPVIDIKMFDPWREAHEKQEWLRAEKAN
jgi:sarcosine oxidase subunit beta